MKKRIYYNIIAILIVLLSTSCRDMNSTYIEYLEGGEIVYVSKADSLKVYPGKNRVMLSWIPGVDNKAIKAMIYWNYGEDSLEYIIDRYSTHPTVDVIIPLNEGTYTFDVYTFDAKGNKSVKSSVQGSSYGIQYQSNIFNIEMKSSYYRTIYWYDSPQGACGTEVVYKDKNNSYKTIITPETSKTTLIPDFQYASEIKYRTMYIPQENSIDTFYTDYKTVILDSMMDNKFFSRWNNAAFPYKQFQTYVMEKMWDGITTADFGYVWENPDFPSNVTFDIGILSIPKRVRIFPNYNQSFLYNYGHLKKFQIWGTDDPNATTDFSEWSFLGDFRSHRPSGLADNIAPTAADLAYASNGEYFDLTLSSFPIRYIRLVIQEVYGTVAAYKPKVNITEITFWGDADYSM